MDMKIFALWIMVSLMNLILSTRGIQARVVDDPLLERNIKEALLKDKETMAASIMDPASSDKIERVHNNSAATIDISDTERAFNDLAGIMDPASSDKIERVHNNSAATIDIIDTERAFNDLAGTSSIEANVNVFARWLCLGGDSCCTDWKWCYEHEGDCDSHSDCARGLVCGRDNCGKFGDNRDMGFQHNDDCCEKRDNCNGGDACCVNGVCGWGQGDCDRNSDCKNGLYCGRDNCRHMSGYRPQYDATDDCCH